VKPIAPTTVAIRPRLWIHRYPTKATSIARYGRWNVTALVSYAVGIAVQIPFVAQTMYTGPLAKKLDGADISWIVGLIVTGSMYYLWARRTARPPSESIFPAQEPEPARSAALR
jgi:NCS1 family nucleobase:cation symporter-1